MEKSGSRRTYLKVFVNLGIMLGIILICFLVVPKVIVFFMPFLVGFLISLIASPLVKFFEKKLKIQRKAGSAFVVIAVIAAVILIAYLLGARLVEEVADFAEELPEMWENAQIEMVQVGERLSVFYRYIPKEITNTLNNIASNVQTYLGEVVADLSSPTIEALGRFAKNLPNILISIIMCLLSSYFFVADKGYVTGTLSKAMPEALMERFRMIYRSFRKAVGGYFKAQIKIELWMYLLLGVGFSILKIRYAFIIAIGVAFLDMLPFFGTGTILIPWTIVEFLNGDYTRVIGLLIIWGVGQLARQLIQPKIVGDSMGLSPIPTLVLLYVGYELAGVIGMIVAVPIGIIVLNLYQEGVFDVTLDSLKILYAGISNFRHLTEEDLEPIKRYREEEEKRLQGRKKMEEEREAENNSSDVKTKRTVEKERKKE